MIFDIVDGERRPRLGSLLRDDTGLRLVNVAFTRARGKLIILANAKWYKQSCQREQNPLLWDLVVGRPPEELLKVVPPPSVIVGGGNEGCESPIEVALLEAMRQDPDLQSVKIQHTIYDKEKKIVSRADFAFPEIKYAVYCDGAQWHLRHDRWQRDWRQRNNLTELGWVFTVFPGCDVKRDPAKCAATVAETRRSLLRKRNRHE